MIVSPRYECLINSVDTVLGELPLQTSSSIEIPAHSIASVSTKKQMHHHLIYTACMKFM